MAIIRLRNINVSFGGPAILEQVNLAIEAGERVSLLGRNGTGKSSLLKVISGLIKPDHGEIDINKSVKIAWLEQEVPYHLQGSIFDVVASGLGAKAELLKAYHHATHRVAEDYSEQAFAELERIQHEIEVADAWQLNQQVESVLSKMDLDGDTDFTKLSGGMRRRVLLARALVVKPDLLLLDEPTNHLDLEAIQWLEDQLLAYKGALLFITHDRAFMRKLSTRIVELDRGKLTSYPCDYTTYLSRREEFLKAEEEANALFDKKLAQEEVWIRQGIKARRTRNEGRVRALEKLRGERAERRNKVGKVDMKIVRGEQSGKLVVEAEDVSFDYDGRTIIKNFNTTILRGDKVGIIGPNGAGKTTLLKILLGQLQPTSGKISLGTKQSIAYFDQMRDQLDEEASVLDNLSEGREFIEINGARKHVIGYLQDFLFAPERSRSPVKALSGGERNRLLLARLFSKPANMLVLDEPTNDLDVETLELLEELVLNYTGTILLVSHDREFVNNVVSNTLVFESDGIVNEYVGGYDDWLRQRQTTSEVDKAKSAQSKPVKEEVKVKSQKKKLSYKDQRDLDELPVIIEQLEIEQERLHAEMADPEFFQQDKDLIVKTQDLLKANEQELEVCYQRWEELEA
ncbi:MAG: ATP-binding cassette domain-containing protein [Gammaproteobacteria bacterium]|nr:ATP-binding cassette domain-containing protein [Gammaproteobacteria bacterium]MCK5262368.1 ATP-binding cassette domain-containing protein [Gammaproteobacteria bacterium]